MKKFLVTFLLVVAPALIAAPAATATAASAPAGRLERDLGHGLTYFRLHALPADLPLATARRGVSILDLRYTHDEPGATLALGDWLKTHSSPTTPVLVLLNSDTAPDLLDWFNAHDPLPGVVTLGCVGSAFTPDIALRIHPAAERAAYDALEQGTPVEKLLVDPTDKPRHDEASIAQERNAAADSTADSDTDIANPGEPAPIVATAPRPVIDYALLRAVQLHHALVALRKL